MITRQLQPSSPLDTSGCQFHPAGPRHNLCHSRILLPCHYTDVHFKPRVTSVPVLVFQVGKRQSLLAQHTKRLSGRLICIWHIRGTYSWPTIESESYSGHNPHICAALTSGNPSRRLPGTGTVGMPTINLPVGSSTQLEPRPTHQQHLRSFAVHAYLGIAVTLVVIASWCFKPRRRSSTPNSPTYRSQSDDKEVKVSLDRGRLVKSELTEGLFSKESSQELVLARRSFVKDHSHPLSGAHPKVPRTSGSLQEMDNDDKGQISDGSDSKTTASRGVSNKSKSTSNSKHEAYLWPQSSQSASMTGRSSLDQLRQNTPSPKAFPGTDGRLSPSLGSGGKGKRKGRIQAQQHQMYQTGPLTGEVLRFDGAQRHDDGLYGVSYGEHKLHFTRPPPPPPLTPPTLDRTASASSPSNATAIPCRRSYTKGVPVGIPIPSSNSSSSTGTTATSLSEFSPSSHCPSSPPLPSPPAVPHGYQFVGGHMEHRTSDRSQYQDEIEVHGEIISVTDDNGDGWRRHTQVYGGGVCLACNGGGFYGPNVPLEDRRY